MVSQSRILDDIRGVHTQILGDFEKELGKESPTIKWLLAAMVVIIDRLENSEQ